MSYTELQFKTEILTYGRQHYNLPELTFNPWVSGNDRANYLNETGPRYLDPQNGSVKISSLSSATAWHVYKKSFDQNGDMYMGRLQDTGRLYNSFGLGGANDYNLTQGKPINVQKLKNWTVLINDCWMLGAIHRQKNFHLVTKIKNTSDIWNPAGYFIVTGRELYGLMSFGYVPVRPKVSGAAITFVCRDTHKASTAKLPRYAALANAAVNSSTIKTKIALFAQGSY
ncbi:hypothetical protein TDB9533_03281 [Thalassocella blandensis]|nr:hypothetical protein TDB9533_03281 [Thalassocella blandensis]